MLTFHYMVLAMGPFLWGKAWLRLSLNPEPEISPHQNQQRQLQFKRKFFITIMDSNKKHQLSLSLSFFFFILVIYNYRVSNFQGKTSSPFIQIFHFLYSSFYVVVAIQTQNLSYFLSSGSDFPMPQARPSKKNFPTCQCQCYCSQNY